MPIGERLKEVRGPIPQEEFARQLDVHKNTIGLYERGARVPDADFLYKVLSAFPEIDPGWLMLGEGSKARDKVDAVFTDKDGNAVLVEMKSGESRRTDDKYCYIPLYNVSASAGGGAIVDRENLVEFLAFKSEWIRTQLHALPSDLYLIYVEGESMEPTLRPGDVILVDHRQASELPRDGIYVVRMDGTLLVKRLQRLPGGVINVTSDNAAYQPFQVNLAQDANGISLIGRVVWCGRRM